MARKRKSGTGTIRQRKDGRWEGRAVVGYDDKGLPKTKNVLAKTKHECQEKLTKLMETVGSAKSEKVCADMPFGEWMDFWYQTYIKSGLRPAPPRRTRMRAPSISISSRSWARFRCAS